MCCSGTEPYPADTLKLIIVRATRAIATGGRQQSSINTAVQFLAMLEGINRTALSDGLAMAFVEELNNYQTKPAGPDSEYTQEVLLLSLSTGLTQAVYEAFALVSSPQPHNS